MYTVRLNDNNIDVLFLQKRLGLTTDGVFGKNTENAVKEYQRKHNLVADGIVGNKTWATFKVSTLTENDYKECADILGCDVASIKAIKSVESQGKGFVDGLRPTILFEGHVFYKNISNAPTVSKQYPNICYPKWDKKQYKGGNAEYDRLTQAWKINRTASLKSASMGLFQIMGSNYKLCGCSSVEEMWANASLGENEQMKQFCLFLKKSGIDTYIKRHDWVQVAKRYNGPGYAQNNYDKKLKDAYEKYNKK